MLKIDMRTGETVQCSLFDLLDGGVTELADLSLKQVLENIRDVNTEAKRARTITVEFTFMPNEDRDAVATRVQVKHKLAPIRAAETTLDVGMDGGQVVACERPKYMPGQLRMDEPDTKIHPLRAQQA